MHKWWHYTSITYDGLCDRFTELSEDKVTLHVGSSDFIIKKIEQPLTDACVFKGDKMENGESIAQLWELHMENEDQHIIIEYQYSFTTSELIKSYSMIAGWENELILFAPTQYQRRRLDSYEEILRSHMTNDKKLRLCLVFEKS